jgi:cytochrome c
MKLIAATLFAATALVATNAMANADLAKKSNCLACHAVDKKLVGPSYQDIAKKYAGQKDAEAVLIDKVKKGGKGNWGQVPMPPNANVKDADIQTLVKWVLAGAK